MLSGWAICERVSARYSQLYTSLVLMRAVTQTLLHTISFHSRKAAHVHVTTRDFVTARLRAFELGVSLSGHRSGTAHSCVICTFILYSYTCSECRSPGAPGGHVCLSETLLRYLVDLGTHGYIHVSSYLYALHVCLSVVILF